MTVISLGAVIKLKQVKEQSLTFLFNYDIILIDL